MNILFYAPFTHRSRDTESLMVAFKMQGHRVMLLNQYKNNIIKPYLEVNGVEVIEYTAPGRSRWGKHIQNIKSFVSCCRKFNIDIVYSHLEPANFIASIAQFFVRAKIYLCRHHIDEAALLGFDKTLSYRLTYALAKKIIVVSRKAVDYMIEQEKITANKMIHINLAYDFSLYAACEKNSVQTIRDQYACDILLIFIGRLNSLKRPTEAVQTLERLLKSGHHAKLLLLGSGNLLDDLKSEVGKKNLTDWVFFLGYVSNPLEYLSAADFLLHPSLAESSCVVVKEAGLTETPVVACEGVGDFDSYLVDRKNAFLVDRHQFANRANEVIEKTITDHELLKTVGINLKKSVLQHFSISAILPEYDKLNKK